MSSRPQRPRASTTATGRAAERRARLYYQVRGYRVLAANAWIAGFELDLVVRRGSRLVFVEVKAKGSERFGDPFEMVDERKQARIRHAAEAWLATHPELAGLEVSFDVAAIRQGRFERLANAF